MKFSIQLIMIFIVTSVLITACNSQEQPENKTLAEEVTDAYEQIEEEKNKLTATKEIEISVEGMPQTEKVTLLDHRTGKYPFDFYTYYPDNFETETTSSGEGDSFIFNMNEARLSLTIFPEGRISSDEEMAELAKELLQTSGATEVEEIRGMWHGHNNSKLFQIESGEHNGIYYYWTTSFPYEYADGFPPREQIVKQEFTIVE